MRAISRAYIFAPLLVLLCSPAIAGGDMKSTAYVDGCGPAPFSGAYIGASVGYVSADAHQIALNNGATLDSDDNGWAVGGHIGYQRQCGRGVYGIEADISWLDVDPTAELSFAGNVVTRTSSSYSHFATLRGRLGIAHENMLFYVTGGLAAASIDHELTVPPLAFSQSDGDRQFGWTIGGGVEFLRDNRWSLRAEVLYVDLGDDTIHYSRPGCPACAATVRWENDFVVARLGFSLKLQHEEPRREPLK